jgi:hypothetical protein
MFELQVCLGPGTDYPDPPDVFRCEILRRDCTGNGSTNIGEISFVEQDRLRLTRLLPEQEHHPIAGWQAPLWVAVEPGCNLDYVVIAAFQVTIFDVHVARRVLEQ